VVFPIVVLVFDFDDFLEGVLQWTYNITVYILRMRMCFPDYVYLYFH
jgi:hypothetical protein